MTSTDNKIYNKILFLRGISDGFGYYRAKSDSFESARNMYEDNYVIEILHMLPDEAWLTANIQVDFHAQLDLTQVLTHNILLWVDYLDDEALLANLITEIKSSDDSDFFNEDKLTSISNIDMYKVTWGDITDDRGYQLDLDIYVFDTEYDQYTLVSVTNKIGPTFEDGRYIERIPYRCFLRNMNSFTKCAAFLQDAQPIWIDLIEREYESWAM